MSSTAKSLTEPPSCLKGTRQPKLAAKGSIRLVDEWDNGKIVNYTRRNFPFFRDRDLRGKTLSGVYEVQLSASGGS